MERNLEINKIKMVRNLWQSQRLLEKSLYEEEETGLISEPRGISNFRD